MSELVSLNVKCPHCDSSLMDAKNPLHGKPSIKMNIETKNDRGTIRLCSLYECHDKECDIDLPEEEVAKFHCPHCNKELKGKNVCESCDAPMIPLVLELGGHVCFCARKGCEKHYITFENLELELKKFYHEYGF